METRTTIFLVDDSASARQLLQLSLENDFEIESFETGSSCLKRLEECVPHVFLLDVELPDTDGYELCRLIRSRAGMEHVPVIFVSAQSDLESCLKGYDAGGSDYVSKPFQVAELRQKIDVQRRMALKHAEASEAHQNLADARRFTSLLCANLDEYAVLLNFMRELNACATRPDAARSVLSVMRSFQLEAVVQLRFDGSDLNLNSEGEARPVEVAVVNQMRGMGRLVQFQKRCVCNYDVVTILIHNMPIDDPDKCGRLRDHIAIVGEALDAKIHTMQTQKSLDRTQWGVRQVAQSLHAALRKFSDRYQHAQAEGTLLTQSIYDELTRTFAHLGLSDEQEDEIQQTVRRRIDQLLDLYDLGGDLKATLKKLTDKMASLQGDDGV